MSDAKFYNQGYIAHVRTREARQQKPMTFQEYVTIQKQVFLPNIPKEHGPVSIIKLY